MPSITCPYCQLVSSSKFQHKQHLRETHAELFAKNLATCVTGANSEAEGTPLRVKGAIFTHWARVEHTANLFGHIGGRPIVLEFSQLNSHVLAGTKILCLDLSALTELSTGQQQPPDSPDLIDLTEEPVTSTS